MLGIVALVCVVVLEVWHFIALLYCRVEVPHSSCGFQYIRRRVNTNDEAEEKGCPGEVCRPRR